MALNLHVALQASLEILVIISSKLPLMLCMDLEFVKEKREIK